MKLSECVANVAITKGREDCPGVIAKFLASKSSANCQPRRPTRQLGERAVSYKFRNYRLASERFDATLKQRDIRIAFQGKGRIENRLLARSCRAESQLPTSRQRKTQLGIYVTELHVAKTLSNK